MKKTVKFIFLATIFYSLTVAQEALPCTIITAGNGKTVLFAGNQDQDPTDAFLVVDNRGPYGVVYFATPWLQYPLVMMKGINEKGLCYDMNWLPKETLVPHPEKKPQPEWAIKTIMKNASTVEDVLSQIFLYEWGDAISYQVHFADQTGDAVVIHAGADGELAFTRKPKGSGYLVSTNFNLARLPSGDWHCWRYRTANEMLSKRELPGESTLEFMTSLLKATSQPSTIFSTIFDPNGLTIYLFYNSDFDTPFVLDVKEQINQTKGYRKIPLSDLISRAR